MDLSLCPLPLTRPTRHQCGGQQGKQQFVVTRHRIASGKFALLRIRCGGRTFHDIHHRAVMLDEIKIGGGDGAQRNAKIAHDGNGFEKNFGKKHGGAPVEINAAGIHLLHQGAEQAEIMERSGAKCGAIRRGVHVRNIGADGEVNGDWNALFVGGNEDAELRDASVPECRW